MTKRTHDQIHVHLDEKPSEFIIQTAKNDITLPAVIVFSGMRGSGKTYACISLVRHFEMKKYITRTFLLCPTRHSNDLYSNLKTLGPRDSFENENLFSVALHQILMDVKKDWEQYKEEQHYRKIHMRAQQSKPLTLREQHLLTFRQGEPPRHVLKPSHMLIVDDAQGTDLYSNARRDLLTHIVIKHRHIPITICLLAQSWTGIPRVIRLNTTHFAVYITGDKTQLKQIYDTFANTIEYDKFENIYKRAVAKKHGFLFIDTIPKKECKRFRNGFGEYLV